MAKQKEIRIPQLEMKKVTFKINGLAPLIVHEFGEKERKRMLGIMIGAGTSGRAKKNPKQEYMDSLYKMNGNGDTGFPAVGFKAAMVRAGKQLGMNMTDTRGRFHVLSEKEGLVKINGKHNMREDTVRVSNGSADIRFRAEYKEWNADITILYNSNAISEEQLASLLQMAGFSCGIGEWRPEKSNSGQYGLFELSV